MTLKTGHHRASPPPWSITSAKNAFSADQTANDNVQWQFGTAGGESYIASNGTDTIWQMVSGGLTIGLGASAPSPDQDGVHIWKATSGAVTAPTNSLLTLENSTHAYVAILTPAAGEAGFLAGGPDGSPWHGLYMRPSAISGGNTNAWAFLVAGTVRLRYAAGAFAFQEDTTISRAALAGVTGFLAYDLPITTGGAANAQVSHQMQLDSVFEAGLSGETDGSGGVTAATQVWKVPYRDSGVNVAAPAALNVEVLGGLRVEAGDDTNRLYFRANAAWHYINQTAGFSFLHDEPTTFGDFNNWQVGNLMALKVDRYNLNGGHALPYPFERATKEALLNLLDTDREFRSQVKEYVNA